MDTTLLELQLEQAMSAVDTYTAKLREAESGATSDEIAKAETESIPQRRPLRERRSPASFRELP